MNLCILPLAYLAPCSHYAQMLRHGEVLTEVCDTYRRQTLRNRCLIAGPQGPLRLTVPIEKPQGKTMTKDVRISPHGHWRHTHWQALRSAYRNRPFFP